MIKVLKAKNVKRESSEPRTVYIRKRITHPYPTNYLTSYLKLSAICRYHEFKKLSRTILRQQRKEKEIEVSKYSTLVELIDSEVEKARKRLIETRGKSDSILLFRIHPKFDVVLGKIIQHLNMQDDTELVGINSNYEREKPVFRLLIVKVFTR